MLHSVNAKVIVLQRQESESANDADTWVKASLPEILASRQPAGNRALQRAGLTAEERVYSFFLEGSHDLDPNDQSLAVVSVQENGTFREVSASELYRYEIKNVEPWSQHTEVLAVRREGIQF